jgi:hypothetical protein
LVSFRMGRQSCSLRYYKCSYVFPPSLYVKGVKEVESAKVINKINPYDITSLYQKNAKAI